MSYKAFGIGVAIGVAMIAANSAALLAPLKLRGSLFQQGRA